MLILERTEMYNPINNITEPAMTVDDIIALQGEVRNVRVDEKVKKYIVELVGSTRNDRNATLGISPRGSIALYKAAKAFAFIYERDFVTPEDVKSAAVPVLAHRIILSPQGKSEFGTGEAYIRSVISSAPVPAM